MANTWLNNSAPPKQLLLLELFAETNYNGKFKQDRMIKEQ